MQTIFNDIPACVSNTMDLNCKIIRDAGGIIFEDNRGKVKEGAYVQDFYWQDIVASFDHMGILGNTYFIADNGILLKK